MRLLSLPVGNDLIEVHNNMWTGYETVYWNGRPASEKFSFFGCEHYFTAENELGEADRYVVKLSFSWFGLVFDVFRNDECLLASNKTAVSRVREDVERGSRHLKRETGGKTLDDELLV